MNPAASNNERRPFGRLAATATLLSVALLTGTAAQAQWKWRDANGGIQLSDVPPPLSVPEKNILQRPGPPRSADAAPPAVSKAGASAPSATTVRPKTTLDHEVDQRRKAEEQERQARRKADDERQAAQRHDNCQRAQQAVATMDSGQRIARVNAQGEREFLSDEQRAAERRRAQAVVSSDCR